MVRDHSKVEGLPARRFGLLLIAAILLAGSQGRAQSPPEKQPLPDSAALATAEKTVKDLYKNEYAKTGTTFRQRFAAQLLDYAFKTKDDVAIRFVLFREAADLAADAGDPKTSLAAIDALAKEFEVNQLDMTGKALAVAAKVPNLSSAGVGVVIRATLDAIEQEAIASDNFAAATELIRAAQSVADKSPNRQFATFVQTLAKEMEEVKKEFDATADARAKLKTTPTDPAANQALGQYLCFFKGDWVEGLPYLVRCADPELKGLAASERSKPKAAADWKVLADGWWEVADRFVTSKNTLPRRNLQERAVVWYRRAFASLSPVEQKLADKRISEVQERLTTLSAIRQLPPAAEIKEHVWTPGAAAVKTVRADEGFCFLTGVAGRFEGGGESVGVSVNEDGFWHLDGTAQQIISGRAVSYQTAYRRLFQSQIKQFDWVPKTEPVKMISVHEGFCFLSAVCGKFVNEGEEISVFVGKDGYWYLSGRSVEFVAGRALCVRLSDPGAAQVKLTKYRWTGQMNPVRMCHKDEGICFLASVSGGLRGGGEDARIYLSKDGYWYLGARSQQSSLTLRAYSLTPTRTLPEKDRLPAD